MTIFLIRPSSFTAFFLLEETLKLNKISSKKCSCGLIDAILYSIKNLISNKPHLIRDSSPCNTPIPDNNIWPANQNPAKYRMAPIISLENRHHMINLIQRRLPLSHNAFLWTKSQLSWA